MVSNYTLSEYQQSLLNNALRRYGQIAPDVQTPAQAIETAQISQPIPTATPEGIALAEQIAAMNTRTPDQSAIAQSSPNIFTNALNDVRQIGTGLAYAGTHAPELAGMASAYLKDKFSQGWSGMGDIAKDTANMVLSTYNTKLEDFGTKSAGEIISNVLTGMYERPVSFLADFASLGGIKAVTKALPFIKSGTKVEQGLAVIGSETSRDINRARTKLVDAVNYAKENNVNLDKVIDSAETGKALKTTTEKEVYSKLKSFSDDMDELVQKYSPDTHTGKAETAITQYVLRKDLAKNPNATYQQTLQNITPYLDEIKAGNYDAVLDMAKGGDRLAKQVVAGHKLLEQGKIMPLTHMRANVEKTGEALAQQGDGLAQSVFARRAYGNATYKDIAKQFEKPETYFEDVIKTYSQKNAAREIASTGTLGGQSIIANTGKNAVYLNRELLENGNLKGALSELRKDRVLDTDIPINKNIAEALRKQTGVGGTLHGYAGRIYNIGKGVNLASGGYLGPNLITGATNALINSGLGLPADVLSALRSRGDLSRALGAFRFNSQMPTGSDWLGNIEKINKTFGGQLMRQADRSMQNMFSEIAAHAQLRKSGVRYGDRFKAIQNMDKVKLGQMIIDTKRTALISSTNTVLPQIATDLAFAANPFWRWWVTSAQSSLRMLEKNPLLANVALMDIVSNIGFDKEMRNRLELGVSLDRPYVSFKLDPMTGEVKAHSAEFVTIGTPLKLLDLKEGYTYGPSIPVFAAILNATQGKDRYGRPLKRIDKDGSITREISGKRYKWTPQSGFQPDPLTGQGDEILSTAVKELIGPLTLFNRTLGPISAQVLNPEYGEYYQPYGNRLIGGFSPTDQSGNPTAPRTLEQVIGSFTGQYSSPYYPTRAEEGKYLNPTLQRQFWKGKAREDQRLNQRLQMRNMIMQQR